MKFEQRKSPTWHINIIAAIGKNRELGKQGDLIWHIPADLKHFRALTMGHPIIMGRKTFESIGKPLPGRKNIVVSETMRAKDGYLLARTFRQALSMAENPALMGKDIDFTEIFIIGGAAIYEKAMYHASRLYLTLIDAEDAEADVYFPEYHDFSCVIERESNASDGLAYDWVTLERAH